MPFLRKYNTALSGGTLLCVPMPKAGSNDFATGSDWTPATGDVKVSKDGGAEANIGTLPSYTNGTWQFTLSAAELSCKQITVKVVDSATKAVDDNFFIVETFGNASAMYPDDASSASPSAPTNWSTFSIDGNGRVDVSKIAGTTQTARDLGAGVLVTSGTGAGQISLSSGAVLLQPTQTGVTIPTVTTLTNAPSDSSGVTTLLSRLSAARAAMLDALSLRTGTAQAGAAGSITLDASASATNDLYKGQWVVITAGTGAGQSRLITGYVGATKVASVHRNWATNPDNTSVFYLLSAADIYGVVLADTATAITNGVTVTTNNDKTGYALTAAYDLAKTAAQPGDAMDLVADAWDSTAVAASGATEIANATLTAAGSAPIAADVKKINATTVNGNGTVGTPWGP